MATNRTSTGDKPTAQEAAIAALEAIPAAVKAHCAEVLAALIHNPDALVDLEAIAKGEEPLR